MIRKPFINEPTTELRVVKLIKELNRIVDELNIAMERIETPKMELDKNGVLHIS